LTEELVEAGLLFEPGSHAQLLLASPSLPSSPLLRLEIQEQAKQLWEHFRSQIPAEVWQNLASNQFERIITRKSAGGSDTVEARAGRGPIERRVDSTVCILYVNGDCRETIRNCLLFLFFGYLFGGCNSLSCYLMLWGDPLRFMLQDLPVKMRSKILFYMITNPLGTIIFEFTILAAPQQSILNFDRNKSFAALYSTEEGKAAEEAALKSKVEEDDEVYLYVYVQWIKIALEETCARAFCPLHHLLKRTMDWFWCSYCTSSYLLPYQ
jgi:hypothetical protein